eukprot:123328-Prymnesium_polylepis.1
MNLATLLLLATELRSYPRSISLDPVVLVRFRRAREELWSSQEPLGALDGFDSWSPAERKDRLMRALTA